MKKILLTTLISGLVLTGCGGSSSPNSTPPKDDTPATPTPTASPLLGKWNGSVTCQYDDEAPMYFKENLTITADTIIVERTNYTADDFGCSGVGTADNKTFEYATGELVTPSNADGIKMQQVDVKGETKIALYVSPGEKHLVLIDGIKDAEDNISYPTSFRIDEHYIKDGADLTPSGATVTVLGHSGINLTTGIVDPNSEDKHDISTIAWSPTGVGPAGFDDDGIAYSGWGEGIWIRPNYRDPANSDDPNVYIKDIGKIALQDVTAAPTSWPENWVTSLSPLTEDHAYVVRLLNGKHAKLRVLHKPDVEAAGWWSVLIEYQLMD